MTDIVSRIGRNTIAFVYESGSVFLMVSRVARYLLQIWKNRRLVYDQMMVIGVQSIPLVLFVGVFAGAVASIQTAYQLKGYISYNYLGAATRQVEQAPKGSP